MIMPSHRRILSLGLPILVAACFSSSSEPQDSGMDAALEQDATPDATPDATTPEASSPLEASVEASPDRVVEATAPDASTEATAEAAVLTVVLGGVMGYEADVPVVWHDTTGAAIGSAMTDATGSASTALAAVSMATALFGTTAAPFPFTVMGVGPGDTVVIADPSLILGGLGVPVSVTGLPPATGLLEGGPVAYGVFTDSLPGNCGTSGISAPPIDFNSFPTCVGVGPTGGSVGPAFPLLVEAQIPSTNVPVAYIEKDGVSPSSVNDAGVIDVDMSGTSWSTQFNTQTVALPVGSSNYLSSYSLVADGLTLPLPWEQAYAVSGAPEMVVGVPEGLSPAVQIETVVSDSISVVESAPAPTASATVAFDTSMAATAPTFIEGATDLSVAARPVVSWTLGADDAGAPTTLGASTAVVAMAGWSSPIDGGSESGLWTIVSPGVPGSSLQAPALPAALSGYAPAAGASAGPLTLISVQGGTALPTYASFLPIASAFAGDAPVCFITPPLVPPLGSYGTATVSFLFAGRTCG
jgi:hypothetical protein